MSGCEKYTPGEFARGKNRLLYPAEFNPAVVGMTTSGSNVGYELKKAFTPGETPVAGEWSYNSIPCYTMPKLMRNYR